MMLMAIAAFVREKVKLVGIHYVAKNYLVGIKLTTAMFFALNSFFVCGVLFPVFFLHIVPVRVFLGKGCIRKECQ